MAWEHFTDYLEPGQLITKAQRDELLDAVRERVLATVDQGVGDTEFAELKSSHIMTDRFPYINLSVVTFSTIAWVLQTISPRFSVDPNGNQFYQALPSSDYHLLKIAAADLGISGADYLDIHDQLIDSSPGSRPRYCSFLFWNIIRRAVQLLQWVRIPNNNTQEWIGKSSPSLVSPWSAAVSSAISATESNLGSQWRMSVGGSKTGSVYSAGVSRSLMNVSFADLAPYNIRMKVRATSGIVPALATLKIGTEEWNFTVSDGLSLTDIDIIPTIDYTTTGPTVVDMRFDAYDDPTELTKHNPDIGDTDIIFGNRGVSGTINGTIQSGFLVKYTFTHPYEEIEP